MSNTVFILSFLFRSAFLHACVRPQITSANSLKQCMMRVNTGPAARGRQLATRDIFGTLILALNRALRFKVATTRPSLSYSPRAVPIIL